MEARGEEKVYKRVRRISHRGERKGGASERGLERKRRRKRKKGSRLPSSPARSPCWLPGETPWDRQGAFESIAPSARGGERERAVVNHQHVGSKARANTRPSKAANFPKTPPKKREKQSLPRKKPGAAISRRSLTSRRFLWTKEWKEKRSGSPERITAAGPHSRDASGVPDHDPPTPTSPGGGASGGSSR